MKWFLAISITAAILGVALGASYVLAAIAPAYENFPFFVALSATTIWAALDSHRLRMKDYRSGMTPLFIFFVVGLVWIVGFPWYLLKRYEARQRRR